MHGFDIKRDFASRLGGVGVKGNAALATHGSDFGYWLDNTNFDFLPLDVMHYITKGMVKNAQEETITDSDWILTPHPDG